MRMKKNYICDVDRWLLKTGGLHHGDVEMLLPTIRVQQCMYNLLSSVSLFFPSFFSPLPHIPQSCLQTRYCVRTATA